MGAESGARHRREIEMLRNRILQALAHDYGLRFERAVFQQRDDLVDGSFSLGHRIGRGEPPKRRHQGERDQDRARGANSKVQGKIMARSWQGHGGKRKASRLSS